MLMVFILFDVHYLSNHLVLLNEYNNIKDKGFINKNYQSTYLLCKLNNSAC